MGPQTLIQMEFQFTFTIREGINYSKSQVWITQADHLFSVQEPQMTCPSYKEQGGSADRQDQH